MCFSMIFIDIFDFSWIEAVRGLVQSIFWCIYFVLFIRVSTLKGSHTQHCFCVHVHGRSLNTWYWVPWQIWDSSTLSTQSHFVTVQGIQLGRYNKCLIMCTYHKREIHIDTRALNWLSNAGHVCKCLLHKRSARGYQSRGLILDSILFSPELKIIFRLILMNVYLLYDSGLMGDPIPAHFMVTSMLHVHCWKEAENTIHTNQIYTFQEIVGLGRYMLMFICWFLLQECLTRAAEIFEQANKVIFQLHRP